ncbi:hypothetical protein [Bradyrhizobium sp. ORS 86]|uniref:hypothetical protein n=1 Tax=Bradyrhizobium sp. ORS 86 TaxID=1685970 RepID=UPI00388EC62C
MRHSIGTAPKDREIIIVEDARSGASDRVRWSPQTGRWIKENGDPISITPTHWSPIPTDPHTTVSDGITDQDREHLEFLIAQTAKRGTQSAALSSAKQARSFYKIVAIVIAVVLASLLPDSYYREALAPQGYIDVRHIFQIAMEQLSAQIDSAPKRSATGVPGIAGRQDRVPPEPSSQPDIKMPSAARANDAELMGVADKFSADPRDRKRSAALETELAAVRQSLEDARAALSRAEAEIARLKTTANVHFESMQDRRALAAVLPEQTAAGASLSSLKNESHPPLAYRPIIGATMPFTAWRASQQHSEFATGVGLLEIIQRGEAGRLRQLLKVVTADRERVPLHNLELISQVGCSAPWRHQPRSLIAAENDAGSRAKPGSPTALCVHPHESGPRGDIKAIR